MTKSRVNDMAEQFRAKPTDGKKDKGEKCDNLLSRFPP